MAWVEAEGDEGGREEMVRRGGRGRLLIELA